VSFFACIATGGFGSAIINKIVFEQEPNSLYFFQQGMCEKNENPQKAAD